MKKNFVAIALLSLMIMLSFGCSSKSKEGDASESEEIGKEVQHEASEATNEEAAITEKKECDENTKNDTSRYPKWVQELGFVEPEGMKFQSEMSEVTSADDPGQSFNSINFVYKGDYEKAMEQAKIIADKAGVPMSEEFKRAKEANERLMKRKDELPENQVVEELKGAIYTNHRMDRPVDENLEYMISIMVDESGILTINIVNQKQAIEEAEKYSNPR